MLGFFPTPYFDELLYSVLARYKVRAGTISSKAGIEGFFDTRTASAVLDLPSHIGTLYKNLPLGSTFTAEGFIYDNTLFPLFEPFLDPEQSRIVYEAMLGTKGHSIHTRSGVMASSIKVPRYLRFCPLCFQEEIRTCGEAHWHRLHQVPGVLVCPVHQCLLQNSSISTLKYNKSEFHPANVQACRSGPSNLSFNSGTMDKLIMLARDVGWLLQTRVGSRKREWLYEQYQNLLIANGLATPRGRVFQNHLFHCFVQHYGEEFLKVVGAMISEDGNDTWLARLTRKPRNSLHPVYHLLFIRFLSNSLEMFFESFKPYRPFGLPPWPCLNRAATHYLQPVITELHVSYCRDTKRPVGTFCCSCGFVFSRRGPDVSGEDLFRIGRIKAFGPEWFARFRELISSGTMSYRAIASILKVDKNTAIKYSKLMTINSAGFTENQL